MDEALKQFTSSLTVVTPLDTLFAEYCKQRAAIERIAAYVSGEENVINHFLAGAQNTHGTSPFMNVQLFDPAPALRSLDASYWQRAMLMTDVLECMNADKKHEWNKQIREMTTPAFEEESVRATLADLLSSRSRFFAERVDGAFRALSETHLTNTPQGFYKRMIINYVRDRYGHLNRERSDYIHDLRCVIAQFSGRDQPQFNVTYRDLDSIMDANAWGEWHTFDGGLFRVRLYKKGTAHLEVHPDMAWKLNQVLAWLHPAAIPSEFRKKPTKPVKTFDLEDNLLSFATLQKLESARFSNNNIVFYQDIPEVLRQIFRQLGGVPMGRFDWKFDYNPRDVLNEIRRTGKVPNHKSYQFYPTPPKLAEIAAAMADVQPHHRILEPSAGTGGIADFLPMQRTTCVEISKLHCEVLMSKSHNAICADFMTWTPDRLFERIVMNPPFSGGRAEMHVKHAATMLVQNGILVAILPASMHRKTVLDGWNHEWSPVYDQEFDGTGVSVAIVKIWRGV